ncbi:MAG: acyltransferase [Muribaculaceae bacterium]|nr:acyltransferase [Muribaculaceae bacterium]
MEKASPKNRIRYYDVARGILIIGVICYHCSNNVIARNAVTRMFHDVVSLSLVPYFMAAFFFISGLCSNFNKPFKSFLWGNFKAMIIPTYIITIGMQWFPFDHIPKNYGLDYTSLLLYCNKAWFIASLFTCRMAMWLIKRYPLRWYFETAIILVMLLAGTYLVQNKIVGNDTNNYFYYCHSMLFMPFIYIGHHSKTLINNLKTRRWATVTVLYLALFFLVYFVLHKLPIVTHYLAINFYTVIWHVVLGFLGSVCVIGACKLFIPGSRLLEYAGRQSLILYLAHGQVLQYVSHSLSFTNTRTSCFSLIALCLTTTVMCMLIAWVLNLPYIRVLIGKSPYKKRTHSAATCV